jgi:OFA family oxalate/formate antiporter-like MFS transporter
VSGILNFVFGFSGAVMSPVFGFLLHTMDYFSMTVVLGLIALVVGIGAAQFVDVPREPQDIPPSRRTGSHKHRVALTHSLSTREALLTRSFWFLWLTWALQGAASIAMVILSTHYGISLGFSLKSAVIILTAYNLTNGVSRLLMGYLSDLVGRNLAMSVTFLAAGGAYLVLPHTSALMTASLLAAIIGFAFGTLFAVSPPLAIECFGPLHFGAIYGVTFTAYGFVAGPLGPSLSGYLLDATGGNFVVVFTYLGLFCVASGILILFVVPPKAHQTRQ